MADQTDGDSGSRNEGGRRRRRSRRRKIIRVQATSRHTLRRPVSSCLD